VKLKPVILVLVMCCATVVAEAQTPVDSIAPVEKGDPETERVDGVWALSGYLGKKLVREFGSRLNLDGDGPSKPKEPVKVTINIGGFRIERTEFR